MIYGILIQGVFLTAPPPTPLKMSQDWPLTQKNALIVGSNKDNDVDRTLSIACLFKILTCRKVEKPFLLVSSAFHALNPSVTSAQAVQFSLQCKHCKSDSRSLNIFSFLK